MAETLLLKSRHTFHLSLMHNNNKGEASIVNIILFANIVNNIYANIYTQIYIYFELCVCIYTDIYSAMDKLSSKLCKDENNTDISF